MAEKKKTTRGKTAGAKSKVKKAPAKKVVAKKAVARKPESKKVAVPKKAAAKAPGKPVAEPAVVVVEARALARYVRVSPQKARLVIDLIRGRDVGLALDTLRFTRKKSAKLIEKVLRSAVANAEQKSEEVDVDRLYVKHAVVNEGFRYKRIRPAPQGRAFTYYHRTSHIEIAVAERAART